MLTTGHPGINVSKFSEIDSKKPNTSSLNWISLQSKYVKTLDYLITKLET